MNKIKIKKKEKRKTEAEGETVVSRSLNPGGNDCRQGTTGA
jgi:hypothetical protein